MYAKIEIGKDDMFGPRGFYEEKAGRFVAKPAMVRSSTISPPDAGPETSGRSNESGLTPEAYVEGVRRFIDVQVEGNLAFRRPVAADPPPSPKYAKGDPAVLTNGVRGASDFKVHWLGWEGVDLVLTLDLGGPVAAREIALSTLSDHRAGSSIRTGWSARCRRRRVVPRPGRQDCDGDSSGRGDDPDPSSRRTRPAGPASLPAIRFVRFRVQGTKRLPAWHPSAGGPVLGFRRRDRRPLNCSQRTCSQGTSGRSPCRPGEAG